MSKLGWWSQPFPPEGGVTGSGVMRQLGAPSMELLDVLVRESAQNSWDASLGGQVEYSIDFRRLGDYASAWNTLLGRSATADESIIPSGQITEKTLIMTVSDRGTSGLGGPLLANEKVMPGQVANFVQFLRNVGEPRDKDLGGGTYGFGKAIFYSLSEYGAILVDTNCTDQTNRRRLMGAALTDPFTSVDGVRHTGRHWWGTAGKDERVPLPLLEGKAVEMSRRLGLPGFEEGETGTDIVVIMPNLHFSVSEETPEEMDIEAAAERIASAILWHLWPKLGSAQRKIELKVSVTREGKAVPVQRPDKYPFLRPFTQALDAIENGDGANVIRKNLKYPGNVGSWALHACQPDPTSGSNERLLSAKPFSGAYHHTARMRQAKLIVDYLECEPFPGHDFGYAAVFLASKDFDQCFADAEPPTHDKWETRGLPDRPRLVVNYATTKLREGIKDFLTSKQSTRSSDLAGLGRLSSNLAPLIPFDGREVGSTTPKKDREPKTFKKKGLSARIAAQPFLVRVNEQVKLLAWVRPPAVGHRQLKVSAKAHVLLDDGRREKEPPRGAPLPRIIGWRDEKGELIAEGPELKITAEIAANDLLTVEISRVPNASVGISVFTEDF